MFNLADPGGFFVKPGMVFGFDPESDKALHFRFAKSNDWETLKAIVKQTDSISAGPREVVQEELNSGVLVESESDPSIH